ncbi:MAG: hypothetical protein ACYTEU_11310, partial [Planctomycetota bacterium]
AVAGDTYEGKMLLFKRGIEVGQVFKLGDKYSKKLGATATASASTALLPRPSRTATTTTG